MGCIRCAGPFFRVEHTCGLQFHKKPITIERVAPAEVKGQHVEQQAEEENVQLPTQVERKS